MGDRKDPAEELYKLFLMGLTWMREDNPGVLVRRGASVFASLACANPVFRSAQRLTLQSWDLRDRVVKNGKIYSGPKYMGLRDLRRHLAESEKHCVVMVVPEGSLDPDRFFGPGGYSHAVTDAGMELAHSVMGDYAAIVDKQKYLEGWRRHKSRMRALNLKRPQAGRSRGTSSSDEVGTGYIPPAQYGEEDYEW
ncbi:MAG TPA: hypothetical protein VJ841_03845 [Candidatus Saccharimonadales bacterium]|nr:hypothetical protein [Candidatus Saccharimonadales bacterium]